VRYIITPEGYFLPLLVPNLLLIRNVRSFPNALLQVPWAEFYRPPRIIHLLLNAIWTKPVISNFRHVQLFGSLLRHSVVSLFSFSRDPSHRRIPVTFFFCPSPPRHTGGLCAQLVNGTIPCICREWACRVTVFPTSYPEVGALSSFPLLLVIPSRTYASRQLFFQPVPFFILELLL